LARAIEKMPSLLDLIAINDMRAKWFRNCRGTAFEAAGTSCSNSWGEEGRQMLLLAGQQNWQARQARLHEARELILPQDLDGSWLCVWPPTNHPLHLGPHGNGPPHSHSAPISVKDGR
jgi:hypothetical protein